MLVDLDKSKNPSQPNLPNPDYHKNKFQKDKKDRNKKDPTGKWCDYHNSTWHATSECKARKKFLEKLPISNLSNRILVEYDLDASTLLASTSTTPTTSTIVDEEG